MAMVPTGHMVGASLLLPSLRSFPRVTQGGASQRGSASAPVNFCQCSSASQMEERWSSLLCPEGENWGCWCGGTGGLRRGMGFTPHLLL